MATSNVVVPLKPQAVSAATTTALAPGTIRPYNASAGALAPVLPALSTVVDDDYLIVEKDSLDTSSNAVTITCAGTDTFASGITSIALVLKGERVEVQAATVSNSRVWKVKHHSIPKSGLDTAYIAKVPAPSGDATGAQDRTFIQAALNSGATAVRLAPGSVYVINGALTMKSNQTLIAHGATIRRVAATNTEMNLLEIIGTSTALIENVRVLGGTWDGNKLNVTIPLVQQYATNAGIMIRWARDIHIEDATVQYCWSGGIMTHDSVVTALRITNCTARYNYDNGIWARPGAIDVIVTGCRSFGNIYHGFSAIRSDHVTFTSCHAWDNGPTHSGEGAGFRFEGARWSSAVDCKSWEHGGIANFGTTITTEGKTGWTWSGAYSDTTAYAAGNVVVWPPQTVSINQGGDLELHAWYCLVAPPTAGTAPARNSPYWVPCAYDSAVNANRRCYDIKFVGCHSLQSDPPGTLGVWKSGATYNRYDVVWILEGSNWRCYTAKNTVTSTTAPSGDSTNWLWRNYTLGFSLRDTDELEVLSCTTAGGADGILIGGDYDGAGRARVRSSTIRNNKGSGISIGKTLASATIDINGCTIDGNNSAGISIGSSTTPLVLINNNSFTAAKAQPFGVQETSTTSTTVLRKNLFRGQSNSPYSLASTTSYAVDNDLGGPAMQHASLTTTARNALTKRAGATVFDSDLKKLVTTDGTSWYDGTGTAV